MFGHLSDDGYMWGSIECYPPYIGAPGGIRTHNRLIRSQMLCPLSYEGVFVLYTELSGILIFGLSRAQIFTC